MGSSVLQGEQQKWFGLERAFREQCVREGILKPEDVEELERDDDDNWFAGQRAVALEVADNFKRTFTEQKLGLRLNVGERGRIIVKGCISDSPAASRRIPPGVFLDKVNEVSTEHRSLQEVQTMMQEAARPTHLEFSQSATSKDFAERSRREASEQVSKARFNKAAAEKEEAERRAAELAAANAAREALEQLPTFSVTFEERILGLALRDGEGDHGGKELGAKGMCFVKRALPLSPAWRAGIPEGVRVIAINGKSAQLRRFKEVKKLIEIAPRPVTVDFSNEAEPTWPHASSAKRPTTIGGVPSYALKPV